MKVKLTKNCVGFSADGAPERVIHAGQEIRLTLPPMVGTIDTEHVRVYTTDGSIYRSRIGGVGINQEISDHRTICECNAPLAIRQAITFLRAIQEWSQIWAEPKEPIPQQDDDLPLTLDIHRPPKGAVLTTEQVADFFRERSPHYAYPPNGLPDTWAPAAVESFADQAFFSSTDLLPAEASEDTAWPSNRYRWYDLSAIPIGNNVGRVSSTGTRWTFTRQSTERWIVSRESSR